MLESSDLRTTKIPLAHGAGRMPALGFGTLIPDPALTISSYRNLKMLDIVSISRLVNDVTANDSQ